MIEANNDMNYQTFEEKQYQHNKGLTLFVGCLDPKTTKEDLADYFHHFDPWVKTKLIVNFKTGQSKQCGLLFCSSLETLNKILKDDHFIHERRVRINPAQTEYKGTKINDLFQVQISGLDPDITLEAITQVFYQWKGFSKARLVQGLHPKQKKVAILNFEQHADAQAILEHSHIQIGHRNCKVSPYFKETNSYQPDNFYNNQEVGIHLSCPSFGKEVDGTKSPLSHYQHDYTPKTQTSNSSLNKQRQLSPLRLGPMDTFTSYSGHCQEIQRKGSQGFVHPVEAEKDSLFRIFCDIPPPPTLFEKKEDPILKISAESKETRDE